MSATLSYGQKLGGHLDARLATIHWIDETLPQLVPDGAPAAATDIEIFHSGQLLEGKYQVRSIIGSGGMGQVFEARDIGLNRIVAIKAAWPHIGAESLRREAQVLAAFRHPGLATVHALGHADGHDFMVMERLSGTTLAEILSTRRGARLPIGECLDILDGIAEALLPLHANGLAHADLKPANIMVVPGGRIVLLDFGIARIEQLRAGAKRISGSPHYMAPEAIRGAVKPGEAHLVDLYALGVIAYVLMTATPPFDDDNPIALMMMHLHDAPPPLSARRPDAPARLAEIVMQMLAKSSADRPSDVEMVRAELRRFR